MSGDRPLSMSWQQGTLCTGDTNGQRGAIIWFTGLTGTGKSTLPMPSRMNLHYTGCRTFVMDGDNVRQGLYGDLGSSRQDRKENIRRIGEAAKLFVEVRG
jgi:adenylylsulfate kinase